MIYTVSKKIIIILFVLITWFLFLHTNALSQSSIDANNKTEALKNKVDYKTNYRQCWRLSWWEAVYWTPTKKYFDAVKIINAKLQDLWDKWQTMKEKHLKDAYSKLAIKSLIYPNKCLYSRTIDSLNTQVWYWKYYKVKDWRIYVWIDFLSYIDKSSDIHQEIIWWPLRQFKNTSTKVREYPLATKPSLQSLYVDKKWFATDWCIENLCKPLYINNFNKWMNSFCNNEKIYTKWEWTSRNRNEYNMYCVKNKLKPWNKRWDREIFFEFNDKWEIEKIDLNRWWLVLAG
jgi:hypothetical protein